MYTKDAFRLHATLSALAAEDDATPGYRREVFLTLGPAPEPGRAARERTLTEDEQLDIIAAVGTIDGTGGAS